MLNCFGLQKTKVEKKATPPSTSESEASKKKKHEGLTQSEILIEELTDLGFEKRRTKRPQDL